MKRLKISLIMLLTVSGSSPVALAEQESAGLPWWKTPPIDQGSEKTGQSFMFTRPVYQNIAAQNAAFWHDAIYNKLGCHRASVQIIPMYQQSTRTRRAAQYFLINEKDTLVVKGDMTLTPSMRDVRAEWLRLPGDFVSTFAVRPRQKQCGLWAEYNQDLKHYFRYKHLQTFWLAVAVPLQYVENDMRPQECIFAGQGADWPSSMIAALNDSRLCFAKIPPGKKSRHSVAEIYCKLGVTLMNTKGFQIGLYAGTIFPAFGHQDPTFSFSPFLGHNRHFGLLIGANFQLPFNCDTDTRLIAFIFSIENQYYLRNFQHRTFDLRFKPWSRYLLLNDKDGNMDISAVNILSPRCKVEPFNFVDLVIAVRAQVSCLEAEVGYSLWAHPGEQVRLEKPFPKGFGIAGSGVLVPGTNIGATASKSTIAERSADDLDVSGNPTFIELQERDLNFTSAAARAAVASKVFANAACIHDLCSFALFWGLGVFVEFTQTNAALGNWGAWGKIGGMF